MALKHWALEVGWSDRCCTLQNMSHVAAPATVAAWVLPHRMRRVRGSMSQLGIMLSWLVGHVRLVRRRHCGNVGAYAVLAVCTMFPPPNVPAFRAPYSCWRAFLDARLMRSFVWLLPFRPSMLSSLNVESLISTRKPPTL